MPHPLPAIWFRLVPTLPVIRSRERRTRDETRMAGSGLGEMSTTHTIIKYTLVVVAVSVAIPNPLHDTEYRILGDDTQGSSGTNTMSP